MQKLFFNAACSLALVLCLGTYGQGQLVEIDWGGSTGAQSWDTAGNWVGGTVPNTDLSVANLSVPLGADLDVSLSGNVTLATLALGGTSGAVATTVSGGQF